MSEKYIKRNNLITLVPVGLITFKIVDLPAHFGSIAVGTQLKRCFSLHEALHIYKMKMKLVKSFGNFIRNVSPTVQGQTLRIWFSRFEFCLCGRISFTSRILALTWLWAQSETLNSLNLFFPACLPRGELKFLQNVSYSADPVNPSCLTACPKVHLGFDAISAWFKLGETRNWKYFPQRTLHLLSRRKERTRGRLKAESLRRHRWNSK